MLTKKQKKQRRHKRVRSKVFGTVGRPRLCVFRANKHIYVQLIDDNSGKTILSASDIELKKRSSFESKKPENKEWKKNRKIVFGYEVGRLIAKKAIEKKIKEVVFDRGGYKYHGRVKAVAEGARDGGLRF